MFTDAVVAAYIFGVVCGIAATLGVTTAALMLAARGLRRAALPAAPPVPGPSETRLDATAAPGGAGAAPRRLDLAPGGRLAVPRHPVANHVLPFMATAHAVDSAQGEAPLPSRAHDNDAGLDLYVTEDAYIRPGQFVDIHCHLAVQLPDHTWAMVVGRSSTLRKRGLMVNLGIIDTGYRGELFTGVWNLGDKPVEVKAGERLAQVIVFHNLTQFYTPVFVDRLDESSRGAKGFGSSGQ